MRGRLLLVLTAVLLGCGDDNEAAEPAVATNPPVVGTRSAQPPPSSTAPLVRADGEDWPEVPQLLAAAVSDEVLLAAALGRRAQRDLGCQQGADAEPIGASIDDYALVATWRRLGTSGQVEGQPVVERCTMRWKDGWEQAPACTHYAPAGSLAAIERSGGGLIHCAEVAESEVAMLWVVLEAGDRWAVVRRRGGYSVAYPVTEGRPAHLIFEVDGFKTPREFEYTAVDAAGKARAVKVQGAVAG